MTDAVATIILAVVQGITEFLPISSDGHLVITEGLLDHYHMQAKDPFQLHIALHFGTWLAVLVYFHKPLWNLLFADRRVILLLIIGTLPAVVFGLLARKFFKVYLESELLAGFMLPLNGLMLLWAHHQTPKAGEYQKLSVWQAFYIGCWQAFALLPGISRSGTTIVGGLTCGLSQSAAATFSFLLSVPAVGGAITLEFAGELKHVWAGEPVSFDPWQLLLGIAVSFVVGLLALSWLFKWLEQRRLNYFGYWCVFVGLLVIAWQCSLLFAPTTT